jgi:hypothetical protein
MVTRNGGNKAVGNNVLGLTNTTSNLIAGSGELRDTFEN